MDEIENLFALENAVSDSDREALVAALKHAYPNRKFLYLRLANKMGLNVADDVISLDNPGTIIVEAIVQHAQAEGKVLELLAVAWTDVPGNPKLKALADRFFPDKTGIETKYAPYVAPPLPSGSKAALTAAPRPALEKLVDSRSRKLNFAQFITGLQVLQGAICTVGTPTVQGTGFLVGRRTVLTNFHVVKKAIQQSLAGDSILCTFDYRDAATPTVEMVGAANWLRSNSPYSQSDLTGTGQPGPDELDYALITLAHDVETTRQPLSWPIAAPIVSQRDFVLIAQHPSGDPAELSMGEVVELPSSGLRYRYDVTTEGGSSGSPVLSIDLELIALHHAADPSTEPSYNQAVPIARIMSKLKAEGIDLATL